MREQLPALATALLLCVGVAVPAQDAVPPAAPLPEAAFDTVRDLNAKLLRQLSASLVEVEYTIKPDEKGTRDEIRIRYRCPNCNSWHYNNATELLQEQRPWRTPGFALAPDEFLAPAGGLRTDEYDEVNIRFDRRLTPAEVVAFYPEYDCVKLKTKAPITGVVPLKFSPGVDGERYLFYQVREDGIPIAGSARFQVTGSFRNLLNGKDYYRTPANSLIVDAQGEVLALSMQEPLPVTTSLFVPPAQWKSVPIAEWNRQLAQEEQRILGALYPVRILLEPLKQKKNVFEPDDFDSEEGNGNEFEAIGLLLNDGTILLDLELNPSQTARLKRIQIRSGNQELPGKFVGSLADYSGLLIRPEAPLPGPGVSLAAEPIGQSADAYAWVVTPKLQGRTVKVRLVRRQLDEFSEGFRGESIPDDATEENAMVFDEQGQLLALGLKRREIGNRYGRTCGATAAQIAAAITRFDEGNVPRSGKPLFAWFGVDLQTLTPALVKAKQIESLLDEERNGFLVTSVYPDSPAARIGIKDGDVLLGLQPEGAGTPIKLRRYELGIEDRFQTGFPWNEYDQLPEQYFDQIPTPWGSTRGGVNGLLTRIGIGRKVMVRFIADGKIESRQFEVTAAPDSFETAERFTPANLGITVCEPTYEVRKYFQMKPEEAAIIIASVRPGSRASVAGIKPYEVITAVNGQPVKSLAQFRELVENATELKLDVRRLAATRVVTIKTAE